MTEKKLSTLGYLMDSLGLSTAGLARRLHVDASLVSKWRSGSRRLGRKSVYFDTVCDMLLEQDETMLSDALRSLAPLEEGEAPVEPSLLLQRVLTDRHFTVPRAYTLRTEAVCTAEIAVYTSGEGRRQAIWDLLDVAESMDKPGEILYVDSEQSVWLMEDPAYAGEWVERMQRLLDRGFIFRVALHFSVTRDSFVSFFRLCSPLIFHRNAHWYYHQYYDENIYWFSFFILEHAMSVTGMSMSTDQTSTTVYTDAYSILQHRNVFYMVLGSCKPMFYNFSHEDGSEVLRKLSGLGREGEKLFSYLPVPSFITAEPDLVEEILCENNITGPRAIRCREINRLLREMLEQKMSGTSEEVIQILQLWEMRRRIQNGFVSNSLSLICGQEVAISPVQCARGLEELADRLEHTASYRLFLADESDHICLPAMNCWCHGSSWIIQMDDRGFRMCHEPTLSEAAFITLEQGWRRVPPSRKDPAAVVGVLRGLITDIEHR